jgi:hypothetical protein
VSVVSGKIIFCEGKQSSLDFRLLNRVVENILTNKPTIVPAGSKFTFSVFVQGYFSREGATNQQYIIFRDRDFDAKPTANIELIPLNSMLLTHRACVENYLINADLIHNYWHTKYLEKQENPISKWGHGDSPGIEAISAWIEEAARSLRDYQTVRWALADLLQSSTTRTLKKKLIGVAKNAVVFAYANLKSEGQNFVIITDEMMSQGYLLNNIKLLYRYAQIHVKLQNLIICHQYFQNKLSVPLNLAIKDLQNLGINKAILLKLIFLGFLTTDLIQQINDNSLLCLSSPSYLGMKND